MQNQGPIFKLQPLLLFGSAVVLGGLVGVATMFSWQCPFRALGVACPGCGCSTAVKEVLSLGPLQGIANNLTATAFLASLVLAAFVSVVLLARPQFGRRINVIRRAWSLVATAAMGNWLFQIFAT